MFAAIRNPENDKNDGVAGYVCTLACLAKPMPEASWIQFVEREIEKKMSRSDLLFDGNRLGDLIDQCETEIKRDVEHWDRNRVLSSSESDLITYLVDKYSLDPPQLLRDQIHIENEGEAKINVSGRFEYGIWDSSDPHYVPGSFVTVAIPFEGDGNLFEFQASTYTFNPPRGRISDSNVLISFQGVKLNAERTRKEIDDTVEQIEKHLEWIRNDCSQWNGRIASVAEQCVRHRKNRLLEQADMVSSLGLPIKRRPDSAVVNAIPVTRKKRPVELPPCPKETFKPEPALPDAEYDYILTVIDRMSQNIERSPSTFVHMKEEQIRDLILVSLNGHYEGGATGETFNAQGKTDILIRADGRNVFIAECKFWNGPKSLITAIDQILGYLTWRDTKAALLLFCNNVDFTNTLSSIATTVPEHPNFKRELRIISDTHARYLFRQKDDLARDLYLAVQAFHIPK